MCLGVRSNVQFSFFLFPFPPLLSLQKLFEVFSKSFRKMKVNEITILKEGDIRGREDLQGKRCSRMN